MDNNSLFSIGEIAKAIGITRKIILNYETKGLITPDLRVTDITLLTHSHKSVQSVYFRT